MYKVIFLFLFIFFSQVNALSAQENSNDNINLIVEGGRVVVDLIKVLNQNKKSKNTTTTKGDCENEVAKLCFQNNSPNKVKILIQQKEETTSSLAELVILTKGQECSFFVHKGIYQYEVISLIEEQESTTKKGEIYLQLCEEIQMEVHEKDK